MKTLAQQKEQEENLHNCIIMDKILPLGGKKGELFNWGDEDDYTNNYIFKVKKSKLDQWYNKIIDECDEVIYSKLQKVSNYGNLIYTITVKKKYYEIEVQTPKGYNGDDNWYYYEDLRIDVKITLLDD